MAAVTLGSSAVPPLSMRTLSRPASSDPASGGSDAPPGHAMARRRSVSAFCRASAAAEVMSRVSRASCRARSSSSREISPDSIPRFRHRGQRIGGGRLGGDQGEVPLRGQDGKEREAGILRDTGHDLDPNPPGSVEARRSRLSARSPVSPASQAAGPGSPRSVGCLRCRCTMPLGWTAARPVGRSQAPAKPTRAPHRCGADRAGRDPRHPTMRGSRDWGAWVVRRRRRGSIGPSWRARKCQPDHVVVVLPPEFEQATMGFGDPADDRKPQPAAIGRHLLDARVWRCHRRAIADHFKMRAAGALHNADADRSAVLPCRQAFSSNSTSASRSSSRLPRTVTASMS